MRKVIVVGAVAALALSARTFAADAEGGMSYNYLEAGYVSDHIDDLPGENPAGVGVRGSVALAPMLHAFAAYSNLEYSGITLQSYEVGLGLNFSVAPMVDLIGRASYVRAKIEDFGSDDGYGLAAGVRVKPADAIELEALLHYVNLDQVGNNTSGSIDARYFFMPQLSIGAGLQYDNDDREWTVGVRYTFK